MAKPLKWCLDWNNLSFKERFLMRTPFVGTEDKAYKDIVRQLEQRTKDDLSAWDKYPDEISQLANKISKLFEADGIWPNAIFLPDDPADIPFALRFDFTDKFDLIPASIYIIEKDLGIEMEIDFWENLEKLSFAQSIEIIKKSMDKNQKHAPTNN